MTVYKVVFVRGKARIESFDADMKGNVCIARVKGMDIIESMDYLVDNTKRGASLKMRAELDAKRDMKRRELEKLNKMIAELDRFERDYAFDDDVKF